MKLFNDGSIGRGLGALVVLGLLLNTLAGCGDGRPKRVPVSGRVLIDGKPVPCGTICVMPENARAASGDIGPDGRFTLQCFGDNDGAVLGTHKVTVESFENVGELARKRFVPKEYGDPKTSGLTVTIDGSTDALEINLEWKGGKPYVERFINGTWQ
ncbi:MAG: hypothetical protein JW818_14240 [Pirellulales bacterium]|nr:hypothetical protein [Pirellulales bacterium]